MPETDPFLTRSLSSSASPRRKTRKTETALVAQKPRIGVAIETFWVQGRQIVEGILQYVRLHDPWEIRLLDVEQPLRRQIDFKKWKPSGMIVRGQFADECATATISTVFCDLQYDKDRGDDLPWSRFPEVCVDNVKVGALGAEFFLRRGYRNLAYCGGVYDYAYSCGRRRGFCDRVVAERFVPFDYEIPQSERQKQWDREQYRLARWLRSLPTPIGVLAVNDLRAQQVLETCDACGLVAPSDVAVLGVDNDELFCELSGVSLSSVPIDSVRGGFTAASLLDGLLHGETVPSVVYSAPLEVVSRRSTDFYPVEDELVEKAIRYVEANVNRPISANLVARYVGVTRRTLALRFEKALNLTVRQYIATAKAERIATLLRTTNWSLRKIAEQTGLNSAPYLCEFFLANYGKTPGEFRRELA